LAIFWLWFLEKGIGMLFSEGNYMNPLVPQSGSAFGLPQARRSYGRKLVTA
jgi:hypothetical protein